MLYRGYSQVESAADSFIALMERYAPSWLGIHFIDIQNERRATEELRSKIAAIPPGDRVVLSYRAQVALIEVMAEEQARLDELFALSTDMPPAEGEKLRSSIMAMQRELDGRMVTLVRSNQAAADKGIPTAEEFMEETTGSSRTMTGLEIGGLILAGVVIMAIIITSGVVIHKAIQGALDKAEALTAARDFLDMGRPDLAAEIFKRPEEERRFPWGWVLGIGTVLIGGGLLYAWYAGYLGQAGAQLARRSTY